MAINLRDYSRTAAQRGWGAGWPSCGGAKAAGTAVVTADRSGTRFSVHKRIARLVDLIVDECERRDYRLKSGQTGGYNCRPIGGTSSPSNHSWGLAIDVNWLTNPMRKPLTTDIPGWVVALFNRYGFAWGGHYSGTPDAMHFEFMGTPEQADEMTALALRELPATPIPAVPEDDMFTDQDRQLLRGAARAVDLAWARDQLMTHLGFDPSAPPRLKEQWAGVEVARRADVGFALGELRKLLSVAAGSTDDGPRSLTDADVSRVAAAVLDLLAQRAAS
jgi:hypothetical protein